ncbi:hypothetical protein EYR36_008516 [Pleurotus pulmonarius]|nr:hypothetical protein EYR36_008516 [Pleurotus pulmonarius]
MNGTFQPQESVRYGDSEYPRRDSTLPLRGVVLCATGLSTADRESLFEQATELGANTVAPFTDRVTHLIAHAHGGPKYMCAVTRGNPIVRPSWITECYQLWLRGVHVDVAAMTRKHRLPVFSDVILCPTGILDVSRRAQIRGLVTAHGGSYVGNLQPHVTHLLCAGDDETDKMWYAEKANFTGEARPPILLVREEWFWDSLEIGARCEEEKYQVWRSGAGRLETMGEGANSEDTTGDGEYLGSLWPSHRAPSPPPSRSPSPDTGPCELLHNKRSNTPADTPVDDGTPPLARLSDLAGVDPSAIEKMLELVAMPLRHPELYSHTGVQPLRRVLLRGPPGCGKTLLVNAVAGDFGIPLIHVSVPWLVSSASGEPEESLKFAFEEAEVVLIIYVIVDELDAMAPKPESDPETTEQRERKRRVLTQFLVCMDGLPCNKPVIVMGITNKLDLLDPALRHAVRFEHEICMGVRDDKAREKFVDFDFGFEYICKAAALVSSLK